MSIFRAMFLFLRALCAGGTALATGRTSSPNDHGCGPLRPIEHPGVSEKLVQAGDQQADDSLAAEVGRGNDIHGQLDPDVRFAPRGRDQRVESKW